MNTWSYSRMINSQTTRAVVTWWVLVSVEMIGLTDSEETIITRRQTTSIRFGWIAKLWEPKHRYKGVDKMGCYEEL